MPGPGETDNYPRCGRCDEPLHVGQQVERQAAGFAHAGVDDCTEQVAHLAAVRARSEAALGELRARLADLDGADA